MCKHFPVTDNLLAKILLFKLLKGTAVEYNRHNLPALLCELFLLLAKLLCRERVKGSNYEYISHAVR